MKEVVRVSIRLLCLSRLLYNVTGRPLPAGISTHDGNDIVIAGCQSKRRCV